jgi:carbon monoxide dehydrogenase subunit G
MEHEVFVPVPADRLRKALADPARVAAAIPGLQRDASAGGDGAGDGTEEGAGAVVGRLKVRAGGTTITYRGSLRVTARPGGGYAVGADATESRGTGTVKLTLTAELRESEDGTTVSYGCTGTADGRLAELPEETLRATGTRLLNRFTEQLARAAGESREEPEPPAAEPAEAVREQDEPEQATGEPEEIAPTPEPEAEPAPGPASADTPASDPTPGPPSPDAPADASADPGEPAPTDPPGGPAPSLPEPPRPPAEAAHARRTMIGRSAEEVDHAPPRGRYAPVPAAQTVTAEATLRWVVPAAAAAVASAIVLARMLRKRR